MASPRSSRAGFVRILMTEGDREGGRERGREGRRGRCSIVLRAKSMRSLHLAGSWEYSRRVSSKAAALAKIWGNSIWETFLSVLVF